MKNKWLLLVGLCVFVLVLVACSNMEDKNDSSGTNVIPNESIEKTPDDSKSNAEEEEPNHTNNSEEDTKSESKEESFDLINISEDESVAALVNKQNNLDENYVPEDLVTIKVPFVWESPERNQLRQVAADALYDMFQAAKESDVYLYALSGYRSYQTQAHLFKNYSKKHGEEAANRYSARPGESEHQTGLVMDVTSESVNFQLDEQFGETKEGKWIKDHAHEYGFVIRYPEGMEDVTRYIYEPWHLRFLGVDLATMIYESGLVYEEYLVEEGIIHEIHAEAVDSEA